MRYVLGPSWEVVDAEGGAIALDKRSGAYLQLNVTAVRVLRSLLAGRAVDEVARELVAEFPGEAHRIGADLAELERQLVARGVVTGVAP